MTGLNEGFGAEVKDSVPSMPVCPPLTPAKLGASEKQPGNQTEGDKDISFTTNKALLDRVA